MMTAYQSDPIGWDEPAYLSNNTCRTMFRKWLIITHPTETPKNIKVMPCLAFIAMGKVNVVRTHMDANVFDHVW